MEPSTGTSLENLFSENLLDSSDKSLTNIIQESESEINCIVQDSERETNNPQTLETITETNLIFVSEEELELYNLLTTWKLQHTFQTLKGKWLVLFFHPTHKNFSDTLTYIQSY